MAEFIVTSTGAPGSSGLTFAAAVQEAFLSDGPDIIRFAVNVDRVEFDGAVSLAGELIIDGDHDGDGISDVTFDANNGSRHLTIEASGHVTIRNIDFVAGKDKPKTWEGSDIRPPAESGTGGAAGALGETNYLVDGLVGADSGDAGHGTAGADGVDGVDAAGSILNAGILTLVRVGFGGNNAHGEVGQPGGGGGQGGASVAASGLTDYVTELSNPAFGLQPTEWRNYLLQDAHVGGKGGDGGRGGNGGNGGDGGDGGDAAGAILNLGSLELIDTVFAGRLSTGVYLFAQIDDLTFGGNDAYGGAAGKGGAGGHGGSSYGGDGGDSGRNWFSEHDVLYGFTYSDDSENPNVQYVEQGGAAQLWIKVHTEETSAAGGGGDGGIGGAGGTGGRGGKSGDAATIINRGELGGKAALANNPDSDAVHNQVQVEDAGEGGVAGFGGLSSPGEGGDELAPLQSISFLGANPDPRLNSKPWEIAVRELFEEKSGLSYNELPLSGSGTFDVVGKADDGQSMGPGPAGVVGQLGQQGNAVTGVVGTGTSGLQTNNSLVYVHGLGLDEDTGKLAFNIIRMGDVADPVTVQWALTGDGENSLTTDDFLAGTPLSGAVTFAGLTQSDMEHNTDFENNVRQISFSLAADALDEGPEGYRFALTDATGSAILGTSAVTGLTDGTIGDGSGSEGGDGSEDGESEGGDDGGGGGGSGSGGSGGGGKDAPGLATGVTPGAVPIVVAPGDGPQTVAGHPDTIDEVQIAGDIVLGENLENVVLTGLGDFTVTGNALDNVIYGNGGNNLFIASPGNDIIDGGNGFDTVRFAGNADQYDIAIDLPTVIVTGPGGSVTRLSGIQQLSFDDGDRLLFAADHAEVHALYLSFLGRAPDEAGFAFWMGESLEGHDLFKVAERLTGSAEFQERIATQSPAQIIEDFYELVLQRPAEAAGTEFWLGFLEDGGSYAQMAAAFAASVEFNLGLDEILSRGDWLF